MDRDRAAVALLLHAAACGDGGAGREADAGPPAPAPVVAWTEEAPAFPAPGPFHLFAAWADPASGTLWAVGDGPAVLVRRPGGAWEHEARPAPPDGAGGLPALHAVDGLPGGPIVAAGRAGHVVVRGAAGWQVEATGASSDLLAVMVQDDGAAWVAGRNGEVFLRDAAAGTWSAVDLRRIDHIHALAEAGGEVWAVGRFGTALRRTTDDQGQLAWQATETDTSVPLDAAWASGAGELHAVGLGGTWLRWDGDAWTDLDDPHSAYLRSLWGRSATDIYAAGWDGAVVHYDGEGFCDLSPAPWRLEAIAGDAGSISVLGVGGRVWRAEFRGGCPAPGEGPE